MIKKSRKAPHFRVLRHVTHRLKETPLGESKMGMIEKTIRAEFDKAQMHDAEHGTDSTIDVAHVALHEATMCFIAAFAAHGEQDISEMNHLELTAFEHEMRVVIGDTVAEHIRNSFKECHDDVKKVEAEAKTAVKN
jgi:hypothetical protein